MKQQPKADETKGKQQDRQLQEFQSKQPEAIESLQKWAGIGHGRPVPEDITDAGEGCHGGNGSNQRADPKLRH